MNHHDTPGAPVVPPSAALFFCWLEGPFAAEIGGL